MIRKLKSLRHCIGYFYSFSKGIAQGTAEFGTTLIINHKFDLIHTVYNYVIALLLQASGRNVIIAFGHYSILQFDNDNKTQIEILLSVKHKIKRIIFYYLKRVIIYFCGIVETRNIKFLFIKNTFPLDSHINLTQELDQPPKGHLLASHYRYFGGRKYSKQNISHRKYHKINISIAKAYTSFYRQLDAEFEIDRVVCWDGIYVTYGVARDIFNKSTNLIFQHTGFESKRLCMEFQPFSISSSPIDYFNFKQRDKLEDKDDIAEFLDRRTNVSSVKSFDSLRKKITDIQNRYHSQKVVTIYPNITWDGSIEGRDVFFSGYSNWIIETLDFCLENNLIVIFREHPQNESNYSNFTSSISLMEEEFNHFNDERIIKVKATDKISSFLIARELSELNIVYNGTIALELAYLQLPVIIAGNSPYSGRGIAYEPKTKNEYFKLVLSVNRKVFLEKFVYDSYMENVLLAAKFRFFNSSYYFPLIPEVENQSGNSNKFWDVILSGNYKVEDKEDFMKTFYRISFSEEVRIRNANFNDSQFIYSISSDKDTRRNSFNRSSFSYDSHLAWYKQKLSEEGSRVLIASIAGEDIGFVRIDNDTESSSIIGIGISRKFRGRKLSSQCLVAALGYIEKAYSKRVIKAYIKPCNSASIKGFEGANFVFVNESMIGSDSALLYKFEYKRVEIG